MIVVGDTSPILNLGLIGRLDLLRHLYSVVVVPAAVRNELSRLGVDLDPAWTEVVSAIDQRAVASLREILDPGESEAIVLAEELSADLLLIDEKRGRRVASSRGLEMTGLIGVLAEAKRRGLILKCAPVLDDLIVAGFWIGGKLRLEFLEMVGE